MADASRELAALEARVGELIERCQALAAENRALHSRARALASEGAALRERNALARLRTESIIDRLKALGRDS